MLRLWLVMIIGLDYHHHHHHRHHHHYYYYYYYYYYHHYYYYYYYLLESHLPPRIHLTVVIPSSPVIGSTNFNLLKNFALDLVQEFSVSSSGTRVAIVAHSSAPSLAFSWYKFMNMECTLKGISSLR